jgi:Fe2+ or Zn2+ uptake regulation protein
MSILNLFDSEFESEYPRPTHERLDVLETLFNQQTKEILSLQKIMKEVMDKLENHKESTYDPNPLCASAFNNKRS